MRRCNRRHSLWSAAATLSLWSGIRFPSGNLSERLLFGEGEHTLLQNKGLIKEGELKVLATGGEGTEADILIDAALEAFAKHGYNGTTTRQIAKMIDRNSAVIYSRFPSKRALLYEIIASSHESLKGDLDEAVRQASDTVDCVRRLTMAHVVFHARHCLAARVANYELNNLAPNEFQSILQMRRRMEEMVRAAIVKGMDEGVLQVPDPALASSVIMSMGIDVSRWYREGRRLTPEELGQRYAGYVLAMLGAKTE